MGYEILNKLLLGTSLITLGGILFKNYWFKKSKYINEVLGFLGGSIGMLLLIYPVPSVESYLYIGTLWVILSPMALFGSCVSSWIAGFILFSFRCLSYSFILEEALVSLFFIISCNVINKLSLPRAKKWLTIHLIYSSVLFLYAKSLSIFLHPFVLNTILISSYVIFILNIMKSNSYSYLLLKNQATKDFLTGVNNHRQFYNLLDKVLAEVSRKKQKLSLILLDIDHFKHINDTYGHPAGDKILKQFTSILKTVCPPPYISRVGGEEFCILFPNCSLPQAYELGEKIRIKIQETPFKIETSESTYITVSIGISIYPDIAKNKEELIKTADQALYKAKKLGRNSVHIPMKLYHIKEPAS